MTEAHILAAVLATWRLTQIVTEDKIFEGVRRRVLRVPKLGQLLTCQRCFSWWAGLICMGVYFVAPYALWPFALSMTFGLYTIAVNSLNGYLAIYADKNSPKIILHPDGAGGVNAELVKTSKHQAVTVIRQWLERDVKDGV